MPPIDRRPMPPMPPIDRSTTRASRRVARRDARLASSSMRGRTRSSATTEDAGTRARARDADDAPRSSSTDGARGRRRARSRLRVDSRTTARALTAHRSRVVALERDGACGCDARRALTDDRARSRDAEDQCWICLDGDTAGREVRDYALEIRRRGRGGRDRDRVFSLFLRLFGKISICVGCLMSHDS